MNIIGNFRNKRKIIKIKENYQYPISKAWLEHYERLLNVELNLSDEPLLEGPSISITILMLKKVIAKMKFSKAVGPSGVVVEMNRAAFDTGATMIRDLVIHSRWKGPSWLEAELHCLPLQGKGWYALGRGNYRGQKLTEQAMKVIERIADSLIRQVVTIDE